MAFFEKTTAQEEQFETFVRKLDGIYEQLQVMDCEDMKSLQQIKANFIEKTEDFFREDRKLNIGVIGQVKAGKSSFLNTMIFDGKDVLPRASTPKTATLTKIEYAEQNSIEITYYTEEEWADVEARAKVDSALDEYRVAKEIIKLAQSQQLDVQHYLQKGTETVDFASEEELMAQLNNYVGESGKLTALVKFVTLKVNNDELKEISIVDTPGLNDPIASRTDKTKQFMEVCDVVFFLSKAGSFLDATDMSLLTTQLPQKGVNRLVLICSRYDEGLQDTIEDEDSLVEVHKSTKRSLLRIAKKNLSEHLEMLETRGTAPEILAVIKECETPIFVSSMAHNMSRKAETSFSKEECLVFENLNEHDDLTQDMLAEIGNIGAVQKIFHEVIEVKDKTLLEKSITFVPNAEQELKRELSKLVDLQNRRLIMLISNDRESLEKQKQGITQQMNDIRASTTSIFTDLFSKLEKSKGEGVNALRQASKEYSELRERTGTEYEERSYTVSTSKWYNPFSWGSSSTEYYTVETKYYYLDVADALENLRHFSVDAVNTVEQAFYHSIDIPSLKRRLLQTVVEHFDASSEHYDPSYFKLLTEKTLQKIELPIIKIDISQYMNNMNSGFSGEIREASSKAEMRTKLSGIIMQLFEEILEQFKKELQKFKQEMQEIDNLFTSQLLTTITDEYNKVLEQFNNKEQEIERLEEVVKLLEEILKK